MNWALFNIIPIMLRARRPSRIADMKAVANSFWLKRGYGALTFFGVILTPTIEEARLINILSDISTDASIQKLTMRQQREQTVLKNHEMIHLRQAQSCHNSWLLFYIRYAYYWIGGQRMRRKLKNAGYWLNPFEMEAYKYEQDTHYLDGSEANGINGWREYAKLTAKERLEILRK